jgi:hypothetical protein
MGLVFGQTNNTTSQKKAGKKLVFGNASSAASPTQANNLRIHQPTVTSTGINMAMANRVDSTSPAGEAALKAKPTFTDIQNFKPTKPALTPMDQRVNLLPGLENDSRNYIGMNLLPAYKEDTKLAKVGKGVVNYGVGGILSLGANIFGAPQQSIMQADRAAVNAVTGKPQDFSEMNFARDIIGTDENNIPANIAGMALDPATYFGGGVLDDFSRAGRFGASAKVGTSENLTVNAAMGQKAAKDIPLTPQVSTREYRNAERNAVKKEAVKAPDVIYAADNNRPLALPAPAKQKPVTQVKYSTARAPRPEYKPSTDNELLDSVRRSLNMEPTLGEVARQTGADMINQSRKQLDLGGTQQVGKAVSSSRAILPRAPKPYQYQPMTEGQVLSSQRKVGVELPKAETTKAELPKASTNASKVASTEPNIPTGQRERGFSANTRTDANNPDALRDSYTENPLAYEQLGNPTTLARAQAIFDQGYESARTQVTRLATEMKPEAVPLAKMLSRQASEAGNINEAREIISDVAEKLTQAGQFTQAARMLREADPETFFMTINKQLKKLNEEGAAQYGKKWKNFDLTQDELNMVGNIKRGDQQAYENAMEAIQNRIATSKDMPSTAMEKLNAWRHMSMLLNPKTHIRNITGNAIMLAMRRAAQRVSGVMQKALPAEQRTQAVFVKGEYKNTARDYFEANKKDLLEGNKYNENPSLNMANKRVFKGPLESVRQFNYRLLDLGDVPFFKNAYVDRLASFAQARGISDFSKLPQEAFDTALKEAQQATYKDASAVATFLNRLKNPGTNANLGQKAAAVITEATLPFTKTPINIIKRGIQYSPAGIINGLSKIKSSEGAAAAIDEMAKGLTGTGIMGLGYLLASKGILTGKAEMDADLAEYNKNTGNSPFSIMGKYTYDWAQPFAVPLTVGVEIYNALQDSPEDKKKMDLYVESNDTTRMQEMARKFATGLLDAFNASGDTVFNMSFMKGIRQLLGSGMKGVMEGLSQLPMNYATQYIPTISSQIAGMVDPTVRQTYYKSSPSAEATVLSRIPFASRTLQPKQTPWGQDVMRPQNPFVRAFSQFLSPGNVSVSQEIDPAVDAELKRLNQAGETVQFPRIATEKFTWKGQEFIMTPEEYTAFQKTLGQNTMETYKEYIQTPEYKAMNDQDKAKELSGIISDAQDLARFQLIQSKGISQSPEIMDVPDSLTQNKVNRDLTFEQQNKMADRIGELRKQREDQYQELADFEKRKDAYLKKALEYAKERAYSEMKRELFKGR